MLRKRSADHGRVAVTFTVPAEVGAQRACLVGACTAWAEVPMHRGDDGSFELTVELPAGTRSAFRYLLDDDRWDNDWAADDYVPNSYGGTDSVVTT